MKKRSKATVDTSFCVGCGVCQNTCPLNAIQVINGIYAKVDVSKCVGCSKCVKACPASTIHLIHTQEVSDEK